MDCSQAMKAMLSRRQQVDKTFERMMNTMEHYYQPEIECASQEQIRAWQDERLVKQVQNVWDNVPYYRKKMEEKGVTPADIRSAADLHKLPFLTKDDLREAYPYGLLARPLEDCVRIHQRHHRPPCCCLLHPA